MWTQSFLHVDDATEAPKPVKGYLTEVTDIADKTRISVVNVEANVADAALSSSGVIYSSKEGICYVVTDCSVLLDGAEVAIRFDSGKKIPAKVIGTDPGTGIGVVACEPGFTTNAVLLGDSDLVNDGEYVVALGGRKSTTASGEISFGVVSDSGMYRMKSGKEWYADIFETDAKVNHDNVGGVLTNINGEMIGMLVNDPADSEDDMGYALTVNELKLVSQELIKEGSVTRGSLGAVVRSVNDMKSYEKNEAGLDLSQEEGVYITSIAPSAACEGILQEGDMITKINTTVISDSGTYRELLYTLNAGDSVTVTYLRDGEEKTSTVAVK